MITSKAHPPWPGDTDIEGLEPAGLNTRCMVRLKIFTIDNRLILKKIGQLSLGDRAGVAAQVRRYLPVTQ